jgi:hypothetical protein
MAITTSGTIFFRIPALPEDGHAEMHVPRAKSQEALKAFALALANYTDADIIGVSYSYEEDLTIVGSHESAIADSGICLFHGEIGKTRSKNFALPAPKDLFEILQGQGVIMKKAKGAELAALYSELTGETFKFIRGRLQR